MPQNKKWLKNIPKSPHQVLAVINEANAAYEECRLSSLNRKKTYENGLLDDGMFVSCIVVPLTNNIELEGRLMEIRKISGINVDVKDIETEKSWRLTGFSFRHLMGEEEKKKCQEYFAAAKKQ